MSSKGRGAPVTEAEFYPTPAWCARRILEALPSLRHQRSTWLEPCAGDGAITAVIDAMSPDSIIDGGDIRQLEQPESINGDWLSPAGFEQWTAKRDAVITNPPFSLAPAIVAHFLPRCDWLILLLRSSFKLVNGKPGTAERFDMRDNMPDEYKLPQRPEFVASLKCRQRDGDSKNGEGCGWSSKLPIGEPRDTICPRCSKYNPSTYRFESLPGRFIQCSTTDASEYSWFVWTPERGRKFGRTCVLPDTPLSERKE